MDKFIYVFNEEDKLKMIKRGYQLVQEDKRNGLFVFLAKPGLMFSLTGINHLSSNTLTL